MNRFLARIVFPFALAVLPGAAAAQDPGEYTAVYEVVRNGEKVANVTLELFRDGDEWTYTGFTHDMHGLGNLLNVKGRQAVSGTWQDGWFQPREFTFSFSLVGYRSRWQADFDWPAGTVTTGKKSKKVILPLDGGAMDPMSLMLNTGSMLAMGRNELTVDVIDEDQLESHLYRAEAGAWLETGLGCAMTTRVERIRKNAKRRSTAWYADELGYIPLQMQHLKKEGSYLRVSLVSLVIDGRETPVFAPCPAGVTQTTGN